MVRGVLIAVVILLGCENPAPKIAPIVTCETIVDRLGPYHLSLELAKCLKGKCSVDSPNYRSCGDKHMAFCRYEVRLEVEHRVIMLEEMQCRQFISHSTGK